MTCPGSGNSFEAVLRWEPRFSSPWVWNHLSSDCTYTNMDLILHSLQLALTPNSHPSPPPSSQQHSTSHPSPSTHHMETICCKAVFESDLNSGTDSCCFLAMYTCYLKYFEPQFLHLYNGKNNILLIRLWWSCLRLCVSEAILKPGR